MLKLKVKKGDEVIVITGKDKGKTGKIVQVFPKDNKVLVTGVNTVKKATKPSQTSAGGFVHKDLPINISNVAHIDPKSGAPSKIKYDTDDQGKKVRIAKKSGEIIGGGNK